MKLSLEGERKSIDTWILIVVSSVNFVRISQQIVKASIPQMAFSFEETVITDNQIITLTSMGILISIGDLNS